MADRLAAKVAAQSTEGRAAATVAGLEARASSPETADREPPPEQQGPGSRPAVAAGVAAQFAAWTPTIPIGGFPGGLVRADRVKARVEAGSDAIDTVVMSAPLADVAVTWKQTVSFDLTNLVYVGV